MMTPSNRQNRDNQHTHQQLTISADVRKLWGVFEQWYVGQRETIDKQRSKALKDLDRKTFSKKEKDTRKSRLNEEHDNQLVQLARNEWDRRLTTSNLRPDQWVDLTANEAYKVERTLGGPLAHLSEKEYVAQMAAQSSIISSPPPPPQAKSQPAVPTQTTFSPPISASSSIQSTSYEYFNPSGYGDADDEREAGSSLPTMGLNGYVTSDEDADPDTNAYTDWTKGGASWKSASPPLRHTNTATLEAKPPISKTASATKKTTTQPSPAMTRQSTSSSIAASSPRHSPPSFASSIAVASPKHSPPPFAAPQPQLARRDEELALINLEKERHAQEEALRKEDAERRIHQQWLIAQPHPSSPAPSSAITFENSAPLRRVPSNESDHRVPAYIGPYQQTDASDAELEEEEFERFKMRVREDKICEFHKEASTLDVHLARDIHNQRKCWGLRPDEEAKKIAEHEAAMHQLRQQKEAERKQIVSEERQRIRAEIKKRSVEPTRRGSEPSTVVPAAPAHPPSTPSVAAPLRHTRRGITATPIASRIRQEAAATTPKPSQRAPVKERSIPAKPDALASDGLPADIARRFAETQRLAQVAHTDSALDPELAARFQQSQRLAQFSVSREPSEGPQMAPIVDVKGKGKVRSASPPSDTSRSSSRMTSAMGWNSSPSAFTDRSGWSSGTESSSGGPRALHRPSISSSSVTMEEVEDEDFSPWMNHRAGFEVPRPQRMATGTPGSSIQLLQSQSESPFMYLEMNENGAGPTNETFSNDVVAISSFKYDEEETSSPNPPGAWDFSDSGAASHMDTPDFWDSLLSSGDAPSVPLPPRRSSVLPHDSFGGDMWTPAALQSSNNFSFEEDVRSPSMHNPFNAPTSAFSSRHSTSTPTASVKKAAPVPTQPPAPKAMPLSPVAQAPKSSFMSPPPPSAAAQVAAAPPPTTSKNTKKGKGAKRR